MDITIDPVAFSIGGITVRWYGIFVMLAIVTLILWTLNAVRKGKADISYNTVFNAAIVGIPSGIVGARLFHVADHWSQYSQNPISIIGGDGLAIYGAVLGAALGIWIYSRFSRETNFGYLADVLAPGVILAQAVGRVGCLINGCCYGDYCDLPWALSYTGPGHPFLIASVHPTQLYEIIYNLIIFGVLLSLRGRFRPAGALFAIYLTFYSLWRFGIDYIREGTPFLLGLHEAQVIALVVLAITLTFIIWKVRPVKQDSV